MAEISCHILFTQHVQIRDLFVPNHVPFFLPQVDNLSSPEPRVSPSEAVHLCDRHFGIGADGVIFLLPGMEGCDYTMRIFNSDGSEPEVGSVSTAAGRRVGAWE